MRYTNIFDILRQVGISLIVLAAIGYMWSPSIASIVMIIGALLMAPYYIFVSFFLNAKSINIRKKRLNRWGLLSAFHYFLAGLFMHRGSNTWVLLLTVSTVFLLSSIFLKREKNEKQ